MSKENKIVSFCIISWNRPEESKEVIENIIYLKDVSGYQKEIVVINNGSDKDYKEFERYINDLKKEISFPIYYIVADRNYGVAGGRNIAIKNSTGSILIFIDDDAVFENEHALELIISKFENKTFEKTNTKIFAFRIENFYLKRVKLGEFPHKKYEERISLPGFYTYYFIGCGHAFRREVIDKTGLYPEDFIYGAEEYDQCFRALNAGYKIYYCGDITVFHKVSPEGRKPPKYIITRLTENRLLVAWKYLPMKYVITHFIFWSSYLLIKTGFNVLNLFKMYVSWRKRAKIAQRQVLSNATLAYLKEVEARLVY